MANNLPQVEDKPLKEIIDEMYKDYEFTQNSVKKCIIVLAEKTNELLQKNCIIKVGDKLNGNLRRVNPTDFLQKLRSMDDLLNTTLEYIGWLKINVDKLENVDENIREKYQENILRTTNGVTGCVERTKDKECSALKWGIVSPLTNIVVGGGGGLLTVAGSAVAIKVGIVSITGILSAIGIAGIAGASVGTVGVGIVVGLTVGVGLGIAMWLIKAYQIGKCRKAKFEEIDAMDADLTQKQVLYKLSVINGILKRAIRQARGIIDPNYHLEETIREDELLRTRAVDTYKNVYRETQDLAIQLPQEQREEIASVAAKNACKAILQTDLIYRDEGNFERFLRERINNNNEGGRSQVA